MVGRHLHRCVTAVQSCRGHHLGLVGNGESLGRILLFHSRDAMAALLACADVDLLPACELLPLPRGELAHCAARLVRRGVPRSRSGSDAESVVQVQQHGPTSDQTELRPDGPFLVDLPLCSEQQVRRIGKCLLHGIVHHGVPQI